MSNQLARLYLRGSLMNETAKLLSKTELLQAEALIKEAWEDPALQSQKMEFAMALGRTIGNDYKNVEAGQQDALIAFWKAALMVLFHESKQCRECHKHHVTTKKKVDKCECGGELVLKWGPKPQIASDPIKRKKFFQTIMFNYLKQILRENKPTAISETRIEEGPAPDVAMKVIVARINKIKNLTYSIELIDEGHHIVSVDTGLIPLKILRQIHELRDELEAHGVQISLDWDNINVRCALEIPPTITYKLVDKMYAKFTSLDSGTDDEHNPGFRYHCEFRAASKAEPEGPFEYSETIRTIRARLPDDAQKYFDLIINTPQDYIEKFGTDKIYKSYAAQYLGIKPEQIEECKRNIKTNCLAMNLGSEE